MSQPGVVLTGLRELEARLNKLPVELRKVAEVAALRSGGQAILAKARGFAANSVDSGLLRKSLGLTVRKVKSGEFKGQYTSRVGARSGFGKEVTRRRKGGLSKDGSSQSLSYYTEYADPAKYAHMVELGTSKTAAKPYIRPAIDASRAQILQGLTKGFNRGLARAVKKLNK